MGMRKNMEHFEWFELLNTFFKKKKWVKPRILANLSEKHRKFTRKTSIFIESSCAEKSA